MEYFFQRDLHYIKKALDKIRLDILGLSQSQSQSGSFALILGEEQGHRRLPIIIGMFEAQAIALEIENIVPSRPMTHDLFTAFGKEFGFKVEEILISDFKEGVFFASIVCFKGSEQIMIDARPSDAIAIGLRFGAAIYTTEAILSEAGIVMNDGDGIEEDFEEAEAPAQAANRKAKLDQLNDMSVEQLHILLDDALKQEDYERAASIRDELNRRN